MFIFLFEILFWYVHILVYLYITNLLADWTNFITESDAASPTKTLPSAVTTMSCGILNSWRKKEKKEEKDLRNQNKI